MNGIVWSASAANKWNWNNENARWRIDEFVDDSCSWWPICPFETHDVHRPGDNRWNNNHERTVQIKCGVRATGRKANFLFNRRTAEENTNGQEWKINFGTFRPLFILLLEKVELKMWLRLKRSDCWLLVGSMSTVRGHSEIYMNFKEDGMPERSELCELAEHTHTRRWENSATRLLGDGFPVEWPR